MILAVSVLSQFRPAFALEVDRRGVEEHEVQVAEQISSAIEQGLLKSVFRAAGRKGRGSLLLVRGQRFSEPCHSAVDVVQVHRFDPGNRVILVPD